MPHHQIDLATSDGTCPAHLFTPADGRTGPAVIVYMDAAGIRPGMLGVAERLAQAGYVALLPDLFYRHGPYGPFDPKEVLAGDFRTTIGPLMATTDNTRAADDLGAFLGCLDARPEVAGDRVGTVGFCMGGGMAIAAGGTRPDRIAAVASFHGGNLATDAPDSPHGFAPTLAAELYVAAAEHDPYYPPEMAARFEAALSDAGVPYRAETYSAEHGWMMPDFPFYDHDAAERGWREMLALFERTLR